MNDTKIDFYSDNPMFKFASVKHPTVKKNKNNIDNDYNDSNKW